MSEINLLGSESVVGASQAMRDVMGIVRRVAPTDVTVLIYGESGTGKEVIARALHQFSHRATKPMVSVNCGAIPEGIIESELFGHERGAFTSAAGERKGLFEEANRGTVFLDEIAEMPLATQVKLLRVIETGEIMRVGSSRTRKVDVRIIAATNKNLASQVAKKEFREDLYYRLKTVSIHLLPLRERPEDIAPLAQHFANLYAMRRNLAAPRLTDQAAEYLETLPLRGNARELRNIIESVMALEGPAATISREMIERHAPAMHEELHGNLPVHLAGKTPEQAERELIYRALLEVKNDTAQIKSLLGKFEAMREETFELTRGLQPGNGGLLPAEMQKMTLEEIERIAITAALEKYAGNQTKAAKHLRITTRTISRKRKEWKL